MILFSKIIVKKNQKNNFKEIKHKWWKVILYYFAIYLMTYTDIL